ncbi:hypothetical protein QTI24_06890 [Variovorax sp. J22P240]|uniref:hypothetical protein n=1 Tax=Variovorax sp. J22P240 TaxID=3053514 RepID=UPI002574E760|nr:hypothetical protein [Variovorax sp. J22P240]MDL9998317.1 hypothetical protein [Variovorax sp. J22P240]
MPKARSIIGTRPLSQVDAALEPLGKSPRAGASSFDRRAAASILDLLHETGDQLSGFALDYANAAFSNAPAASLAATINERADFRAVLQGVQHETRKARGSTSDPVQDLVKAIRDIIDDPSKSSLPEAQRVPPEAAKKNGLLRALHKQLDFYSTRDDVIELIDKLAHDTYVFEHMVRIAVEGLVNNLGPATAIVPKTADTADWDALGTLLRESVTRARSTGADPLLQFGSLIYVYWLDEAGLFWAAERLTDRLQNGVVPTTAPLAGVRVSQLSLASRAMAQFARIWRQGQLAPVGERAAQYAALYGYSLHIAGRAAPMLNVDVMKDFPNAFNQALRGALRFYKETRNLMIVADVTAARQAFEGLARVLDQGNENLRMVKPMEFRVQAEYVKLLLGGSTTLPFLTLYDEWRAALTPRPGVADSMQPWQVILDAVSDRYRLRSVSSAEYHTLAENGEAILVATRLLQLTPGGLAAVGDNALKAFLLLLEDAIQKYAGSLGAVTGLDLRSDNVSAAELAAPPSKLLAGRYAPPAVSPLRDEWPRPLVTAKS